MRAEAILSWAEAPMRTRSRMTETVRSVSFDTHMRFVASGMIRGFSMVFIVDLRLLVDEWCVDVMECSLDSQGTDEYIDFSLEALRCHRR